MEKERCITVYCGSSAHTPQIYVEAACKLGEAIAAAGATLVYGAGRTGLMGAVADAVLGAGGKVLGIIPEFMVRRGWHHTGLSELKVVDSMHTRKAMMSRMATGIVALPGGMGTLEELTEAITWRQLGLYDGNIAIYNVAGYYDSFIGMMTNAIDNGFMNRDHSELYRIADSATQAVEIALAPVEKHSFSAKF